MATTELVTTLKRNATKIIARARRSRSPVLITQHGLPAAYLVDAESYEALQARMQILEGLARGEEAVRDGRVMTQKQFEKKMARWLK